MADNKEVEIKIVADTSDVDKSMKEVSKSADRMAKDVNKAGDKAEDAFDDLSKQLKDVTKEMKNISKSINLSGLTNSVNKAMNTVKKTVDTTVKSIKQQFQEVFNMKGNVEINAKTTADISGQNSVSDATALMGQAMTSGAIGSSIQHNLAQTGDIIEDTMDGIGDTMSDTMDNVGANISDSMSNVGTTIKDTMTETGKVIETSMANTGNRLKQIGQLVVQNYKNMQAMIVEAGGEASDLDKDLDKLINHAIHFQNAMAFGEGGNLAGYQKLKKQLETVILSMDVAGFETDEFTEKLRSLHLILQNQEGKAIKVVSPESMKEITDLTTTVLDCANQMGLGFSNFSKTVTTYFKQIGYEGQSMANKIKDNQQVIADTTDEIEKHTQSQQKASKGNSSLTQSVRKLKDSLKQLVSGYREVNKEQDKVSKSSKKTEGAFTSLAKSLAPYLKFAAIFGSISKAITSYTHSLNDVNKMSVSFGGSTQDMKDWLESYSATVTTSKADLIDFSTSLFRMGKNMELSTKDTISMTQEMTKLGADLVALTDNASAMDALAGALRGEYDSLQNFGFTLDNAAVESEALRMGLDASTESAKALARQSLILKQAQEILGYAADEAQTLGGQLQMLQKNFIVLGTSIGSCFAGILQVVLPVLNSIVVAVTDAFNKIAKVINAIFGIFGIKVGGASASGGTGGGAIGDAVGNIGGALADGLDEASGGAGKVADDLASGAESAKEIASGLMGIDQLNVLSSNKDSGGGSGSGGSGGAGGSGGGAGVGALGDIAGAAQEGSSVVEETFEELEGWMKDLVNGFVEVFNMLKAGWQSVGDYISTSIANLKQAFSNLGQSIKDFLINAWNNGGAELVFNFGRLAGAVTGAIIDISGQCVQMVADLFSHLDPSKNKYTQAFIKGLNNLLIECENFALKAGGWFETFVDNGGQAFLNVMGDIVMILGTTLAKTFANIVKWITMFMDSWAGQTLIKACAITLNVLAGALKAVLIIVEKLSPVWSALLVAMGAKATVTGIITLLGKMKKGLIDVGLAIAASLEATLLWVANGLKKLVTVLGTCITATLKFAASLLQGVWSAIVSAASGMSTYIMSLSGVIVAEGGATAGAVALKTVLDALGIGLLVAAIVALIAAVVKIGEKFGWWKAIGEALGGMFDWLGEKLGWIWDKITGFFGWTGDNKIEPEVEETDESLDGLGDTIEEVSDRFGTSCNAINKSLASIGIDTNKLALQLDEAEASFNEKFSMISANAKEYLDAVVDGNEDMLKEMSGDADKYTAEIKSAFKDMSVEEQAIFYSTYGEIEGVTDGWLDYTKGSYEECLIKHAGMLEQINKDDKLTYNEKKKRIEDERKAFVKAQNEKIREFNLAIADIESSEEISEEQRYSLVKQYTDKRDKLIQDMESYQLGSIDTVDDAVKVSTKTQKDAYNNVGSEQEKALKNVDTSLQTTKKNLSSFKTESNNVAKEIPKAWQGIGQKIGQEFTNALNSVKNSFTGILNNTRTQCTQLKDGLQKTFNEVKNGVKSSMVDVNTTITSKFNQAVNSVKSSGNGLKTSLQNIFQSISSGLSKSFDGIKNTMSNSFKSVSATVTSTMNSCKTTMSNALSGVASVVKDKTNNIKNTVSNNFKSISQTFTKPFTDANKSVSNSLNTVKNSISSKMDSIVKKIKSCASSMKSAMNFNFPTPYMKMPHIKVTGNWNFEKKTVPKFSVSWWSSGAIFNKRTILGNMGVGDAQNGYGNNPEAVLPLDSLWKELGEQFDKQNRALSNKGNNQPIVVNVQLDGKTIATTTVDNFKQMARLGNLDTSWL